MTTYSILNGSRMIEQSQSAICALQCENDELSTMKTSYTNISTNSEVQGQTATNMKTHMDSYCGLLDATIGANNLDITDHTILIGALDGEFYDGALIKQEQENALAEKARDEAERDRCYREWQDHDDILVSDYYYYRYKWFCGEVDNDEAEYQAWLQKEQKFDEMDAATAGLFANSGTIRSTISANLSLLVTAIADGDYSASPLASDWQTTLQDLFNDQLYILDDQGNRVLNMEYINASLERYDNLSDIEKMLLGQALSEMAVNQGTDLNSLSNPMKQAIMAYLEHKMNEGLTNANGDYIAAPFDKLTQDERNLYVSLYEEVHPEHAQAMNHIRDQFSANNYIGWETDIMNIKFLAYTANEPYKSIYLDNIHNAELGSLSETGTSYASGGAYYIDASYFNSNDGSSYWKFFHETSHCIDYFMEPNSTTYNVDGYKLNDVLEDDVRNRINSEIDEWLSQGEYQYLSDAEKLDIKYTVMDSIMNQVDAKTYGMPDFTYIQLNRGDDAIADPTNIQNCYTAVTSNIRSELSGPISDTYGGFTGNTLMYNSYHEAIRRDDGVYRVYWVNGEINDDGSGLRITLDDGRTYVYDDSNLGRYDEDVILASGEMTYSSNISAEFFAEQMEANMTQRPKMLNQLDLFDENTQAYADQMFSNFAGGQ